VITDSGGIQEETTYLGVPCLTLRSNTERPITVTMGTNVLVGPDPVRLRHELDKILRVEKKRGVIPPLWDGLASERIADILTSSESKAGPGSRGSEDNQILPKQALDLSPAQAGAVVAR